MPTFPIFNGPEPPSSPYHPMEIDECDISEICDSLSLSTPLPPPPPNTPSTQEPRPFMGSATPSTPSYMLVEQGTPSKGFVSRCISAFADLDDETMRRIAMMPYLLSGYVQLLFNISLPALLLYWLYSFGHNVQSDVEKKVLLFSEEVMEQIAKCSRDYRDNRCDPSSRVPALMAACQSWEECMNRDPHLVAKRSGIAAEIFGETLNSFFNVLSWKSIVSLVVLVLGVAALFNVTFSMVARRNPAALRISKHEAAEEDSHSPIKSIRKSLMQHASPLVSRRRKFH